MVETVLSISCFWLGLPTNKYIKKRIKQIGSVHLITLVHMITQASDGLFFGLLWVDCGMRSVKIEQILSRHSALQSARNGFVTIGYVMKSRHSVSVMLCFCHLRVCLLQGRSQVYGNVLIRYRFYSNDYFFHKANGFFF